MVTVLGQHNGISLIRKEDGSEFYYSPKTKTTAIGIKGLARLLDCDAKTVARVYNKLKLRDDVSPVLELEMYTQQGIQGVTLIHESILPMMLTELSIGKKKESTKNSAIKLQEKLAQAGFRLMVMLEVAPEELAREAINRIDSPEKADKVAQDASLHGQYLRSHIAINYEAEKNNLKAGKIVGENNLALGLPYSGGRHQANNNQKATLTVTQLDQSSVLNSIRKSDQNLSEIDKYQACDDIRQIYAENRKAVDAIIAKYLPKN